MQCNLYIKKITIYYIQLYTYLDIYIYNYMIKKGKKSKKFPLIRNTPPIV